MNRSENNIKGLTSNEVNTRIKSGRVNYIDTPPTKSIKEIIYSNFFTYFNFLNAILGLAIIFAGIYGSVIFESLKNCLFMGVIIVNSIIAIIQEIISKKTIDKLNVLSKSKIKAIRDNKEVLIDIEEIVIDDVLIFEIGNQVVVDSLILSGNVEVDESFITGESDVIYKKEDDNILSGSFITSGKCYVKVINIGKDNYISKISSEAKYNKVVNSVIMNSFTIMLKILSILIVPVGILLFGNQYIISNNITNAIFDTVAALIGMIPEGLLLLTSSVMAVSVIRLSKYNVLVQHLYCIEALARVDVICLDKTGTITEGKMNLVKVIKNDSVDEIYLNEVISNIASSFDVKNNTMEAISKKYQKGIWTVINKIEFSSARKFSAVSFDKRGNYYIGAAEYLLKDNISKYKNILDEYQDYRVLVLASSNNMINENPSNLEVLGFLILEDVIRKEAPDTLKYFKDSGVKVILISGDNPSSVASIAKRAGMDDVKEINADKITIDNIDEILDTYNVIGRVKPDGKKMIIKHLQSKGHTVAMTGDGVNDVLALKEADCSIAMASGSDAAKNVSHLVLLDSNFSSMPKIVAEGRRTINNIERSASLLLVKPIFSIILSAICILMSSEYFYMPIHLTLITACTISIPSFILALEPNNERVKGNFMFKVISKSVPAALTVVFNVVMIVLFRDNFTIDESLTETLIVLMTGTTGFLFLFRLCKPFNILRTIMYILLITIFAGSTLFASDFFDISQIKFGTVLLYIVFAICSVYIFNKLNIFIEYIIKKVDEK